MDIIKRIAPNLPKSIQRPGNESNEADGIRKRTNHRKLPLPSIILANARSINNKVDELDALVKFHHAYKNASAIAITETWLSDKIADSHISIDGFNLFRADRDTNATNKSCGGGCLWLIKKEWCTNTTVHRHFLSSDLELLHIKCRPHYLPREINVLNLLAIYIPPDANTKSATTI